uniref:Uncharacterized protein n=1 Tax=Zea mays TaxID=4577 RepID=A0A804MY81_MAIZE
MEELHGAQTPENPPAARETRARRKIHGAAVRELGVRRRAGAALFGKVGHGDLETRADGEVGRKEGALVRKARAAAGAERHGNSASCGGATPKRATRAQEAATDAHDQGTREEVHSRRAGAGRSARHQRAEGRSRQAERGNELRERDGRSPALERSSVSGRWETSTPGRALAGARSAGTDARERREQRDKLLAV